MFMGSALTTPRSTLRLFATYAAITLVPVLVLALVLAVTFRSDANQRGLQQGRSEATLIAQTAIEPQLDGSPLSAGISAEDRRTLRRLVNGEIVPSRQRHDVLPGTSGWVRCSVRGAAYAPLVRLSGVAFSGRLL